VTVWLCWWTREPVKLIDALEKLRQPLPGDAPCFRGTLACGFTPLHFDTFLRAHLALRLSGKRVHLETGLFGDLRGNLERFQKRSTEALFVVIEWPDLEPRLGVRTLGGWSATDLPDIVNSAAQVLSYLQASILRVSGFAPVFVSTPTLPLPPLFTALPRQATIHELQLRERIAFFSSAIAVQPGVRVTNSQLLDEISPLSERFDLKSDLQTGFPYKLSHASCLAECLAAFALPSAPKKALITDLDDTLWAGILGEVGAEGISWSLDQGTNLHGIYQQFLESLASAGILLAVASKNELQNVHRAFERNDLRISKNSIYPFEVHWSLKSESVRRILDLWNIAEDSVVFLDDSPMEVAEVKAAFPEMECMVFPKDDHEAFWALLKHLRGTFGKSVISDEDLIRMKSIREAAALHAVESSSRSLDDFLKDASASIRIEVSRSAQDNRAFELLNKTNQFNLNGKRLTEAEWRSYLLDPHAFLMTVNYGDKYGPLGKIAAVLGKCEGKIVGIDHWVMSCRAFSRRIEHQTLRQIFDRFQAEEIRFDYQTTGRNMPLQEFFVDLLGASPYAGCSLSVTSFSMKSFQLFQRVEETVNG
jgi:FkbH-like protein